MMIKKKQVTAELRPLDKEAIPVYLTWKSLLAVIGVLMPMIIAAIAWMTTLSARSVEHQASAEIHLKHGERDTIQTRADAQRQHNAIIEEESLKINLFITKNKIESRELILQMKEENAEKLNKILYELKKNRREIKNGFND